jgi:tRNA A37 threonylcarbamoyladenosine biosynthesis protein TsaE
MKELKIANFRLIKNEGDASTTSGGVILITGGLSSGKNVFASNLVR